MGRCFACKTVAAKNQNLATAAPIVSHGDRVGVGMGYLPIPLQARLFQRGVRVPPPEPSVLTREIPLQLGLAPKVASNPLPPLSHPKPGGCSVVQLARQVEDGVLDELAKTYVSLLNKLKKKKESSSYWKKSKENKNVENHRSKVKNLNEDDSEYYNQKVRELEENSKKTIPYYFQRDSSKRKGSPTVLQNEPPTKKKPGFRNDKQGTSNNYNLTHVHEMPIVLSPVNFQSDYGLSPIFEHVLNNSNMPPQTLDQIILDEPSFPPQPFMSPILNDLQGSIVLDRMGIQRNQPLPQPHLLAATIGNEQLWGAEMLRTAIAEVGEYITNVQLQSSLGQLYQQKALHIRGGRDYLIVAGKMIYNKAGRSKEDVAKLRYPNQKNGASGKEADNTAFALDRNEILFKDLGNLLIGKKSVRVDFQKLQDYHHPRINYPVIMPSGKPDLSYAELTVLAGSGIGKHQAKNLLDFLKTGALDETDEVSDYSFGFMATSGTMESLLTHLLLVEAQKDNTLYLSTIAGLELVAAGKLKFRELFSEFADAKDLGLENKGGLLPAASKERYTTGGMREAAANKMPPKEFTELMAQTLLNQTESGPAPPIWAVKHMLLLKKWLEHLAETGAFRIGEEVTASTAYERLVLEKLEEYYGEVPR